MTSQLPPPSDLGRASVPEGHPEDAAARVCRLVLSLGDTNRIAEFLAAINALRDEDLERQAAALGSPRTPADMPPATPEPQEEPK